MEVPPPPGRETHVGQNCLKILGNLQKAIKFGNAVDKARERLFFGKLSVSFRTIFEKFENQQKTLGKQFWTDFKKNEFSETVGKFSVDFRNIFVFAINKLFINQTARAVP